MVKMEVAKFPSAQHPRGQRGLDLVRDDPVPPLPVQQRSWLSWRVELGAPTTAYLCPITVVGFH